ncbi:MAG: hypothetical protein LKF34_01600 [Acidaminococcaceae bacterium]|jgi:hypothetical protein|nr:hypothetical protein [Acidaminococcaceae bacterium]
MRTFFKAFTMAALVAAVSLSSVTALAATSPKSTIPQGREGMAYREEAGPESDVFMKRNPDGSVARGSEGMADREHPLYGDFPFDTLSRMTGRSYENLFAEAYRDKLTAAGLAKKLGLIDEYKANRMAAYKKDYQVWVQRGWLTRPEVARIIYQARVRINHLRGEQIDWVETDAMRQAAKTATPKRSGI